MTEQSDGVKECVGCTKTTLGRYEVEIVRAGERTRHKDRIGEFLMVQEHINMPIRLQRNAKGSYAKSEVKVEDRYGRKPRNDREIKRAKYEE